VQFFCTKKKRNILKINAIFLANVSYLDFGRSQESSAILEYLARADVKKIYDSAHKTEEIYFESNELTVPQEAPNTFGVVCIIPNFWETLQLENEYVKSHRYQFHLKEDFGKNSVFM
jgi:hypothetical protein